MEEETVKCGICGKELSGNDLVYFLDNKPRPYCSGECLIKDLSVIDAITAEELVEETEERTK